MQQDKNVRECIEACWNCRAACQETLFTYCLKLGGKHVEAEHVRLMADCIAICQVAADFMTRRSALHPSVCAACAQICEACGKSCEKIGGEEMMHCADLCRRCAETCSAMSKLKKAA